MNQVGETYYCNITLSSTPAEDQLAPFDNRVVYTFDAFVSSDCDDATFTYTSLKQDQSQLPSSIVLDASARSFTMEEA